MPLQDAHSLRTLLDSIDGKGYGAYKRLRGRWEIEGFELRVDHVQGDPFAAPSRLRILAGGRHTGLPSELCTPGARAIGTACCLARAFAEAARKCRRGTGSGRSGELRMEAPGQEVLEHSALRVGADGGVETRFRLGLPARGRRVMGREAARLLLEAVPALARATFLKGGWDEAVLRRHAEVNEDADALRDALAERGLLAFVAEGALLPRRSGVDDRPLEGPGVVPFRTPPSLELTIELPNAGPVRGMGVPPGVTLITGGGYHGKSTLLRALQAGVGNHRPGDGREFVVTRRGAVKIRAEDGRAVTGVDISPFIGTLPGGRETRSFSTPNASGSTSQAAAIMEALEAGAEALLIDEDTSATNFMIRDRRMQLLVPREREPITPFIDRVRELHAEHEVSTVLVVGGSGDYLDVADTVITMTEYHPSEVTERARAVAAEHPTGRVAEAPGPFPPMPRRVPRPGSVDPSKGRREVRVRLRGEEAIHFGDEEIDLSGVEQVVSVAQLRAISEALVLARQRVLDGERSVPDVLDEVMAILDREGLDALGHGHDGDLARFRRHELAAALNRLRSLEVEVELR